MPKWTQDRIVKKALEVQLSISKLEPLQQTLTRVEKLCERITGVSYCIDLDERHQAYQKKRQQQTEPNVAAESQKPVPNQERGRQKPNAKQREAHQRLFSKKKEK